MGLQKRDDDWQASAVAPKTATHTDRGLRYLLGLAGVFAALWLGAEALLEQRAREKLHATTAVELVPGGVVLKSDRQGHFRGTALVNGTPVPFMVDTGATRTVIPAELAVAAGLPRGRRVPTLTAGGQVHDHETTIRHLQIGNVVIEDIEAQINDHIDEALLGMNTLRFFRMTQEGDTLRLTTSGASATASATGPELVSGSQPRATTEHHTGAGTRLVCDPDGRCEAQFSD